MARIIRAERSGPALVPGEVADARNQARDIIERARAEARALREQAEREAEEVREQAREQGRQEGRAEAAALLARATAARDSIMAESERQIVRIALAAAGRIVGEQLSVSPESISAVVAPLLERARSANRLLLRVSPLDAEALRRALPGLQERAELRGRLALEPDESIERGGCVLETDIGLFDARIEVQIEALAKALGA